MLPLRVSVLGCVAGLLVALVGFWIFLSGSVSGGLLLLTIGWFDAIAFGALAVVAVVQRRGGSD
ncbi:MAG: hypothetical protein U0R76_04775 [Candidatus Nanopelagicales bacterium]